MNSTVVRAILKSPEVAVDTETNSLDALKAALKGVSLAWTYKGREWSHYWSFNSDEMPVERSAALWHEFERTILCPLFKRKAVVLCFHNAPYDLKVFRARNLIPEAKRISDTMIMSFLLDENKPHDLKSCARDFLGIASVESHSAVQKRIKQMLKEARDSSKVFSSAIWEAYRDFHHAGVVPADPVIKTCVLRLKGKMLKKDVIRAAYLMLGRKIEEKAQSNVRRVFHNYGRQDALWTLRLHKTFLPAVVKQGFGSIYWNLYQSLVRLIVEMEVKGVKLDISLTKKIQTLVEGRIEENKKALADKFGAEFNPRSSKQVKKLLWQDLELTPPPWLNPHARGADGQPGSGEEILEYYVEQGVEQLKEVLLSRKLTKLKSTYIDPLIEMAELDPEGRIHPSFSLIKRTSRWGCSNPNLMNIPRWGTLKKYIPDIPSLRACFITDEGYVLLVADFSQIDLRCMTHYSKDPSFMKSYRTWKCKACKKTGETNQPYHACPVCKEPEGERFTLGEDIHMQTAKATGLLDKLGPKDGRDKAKGVNFGAVYLMGPQTLSRNIGVSFEEAKEILNTYHRVHPGVRALAERLWAEVEANGYFRMLNGMKRRFTNDLEKYKHLLSDQSEAGRKKAYMQKLSIMREEMNNLGQGGTAVIINTAAYQLWQRREQLQKWGVNLLLQVHDELVFECPKKHAKKASIFIRDIMEGAGHLDVPVLANVHFGTNWEEAK